MNYFLILLIFYLLYRLIKSNLFFIRFNKKNDVKKNNKKIFIDSKDLIEADFDEINEGDNKNE
tara:strand:+ start:2258 stop:2446 length:189 start_codon:yes stop_codon:yes gene_type:complete